MIRRLIDLAAALSALVVLSPLILVLAVWIRLDSPGPAFYAGARAGLDGRRFRMWKFRTMVADADRVGPGITGSRDPRITRLGRFLRASKLDELPQFFNLLLGDLTLVGPRAEDPAIVERYTDAQREVLTVKPGITGPGAIYYTTDQQQVVPDGVSAEDFYVEHLLGPKLELDLDYVRRRSAVLDLEIVGRTVLLMLRGLFSPSRAA